MIRSFTTLVFALFLLTNTVQSQEEPSELPVSAADISGIYSRTGNIVGRGAISDGNESIDTFTGRLQLSYVDAVIPGDGGFDLPITRTYSSAQHFNDDSTNRVFGIRWDIHFGRIKSNATIGLFKSYCVEDIYLSLWSDDRFNPVFQEGGSSS